MKIYTTRCEDCDWTAERTTRPDARDLGLRHEEKADGHYTNVEKVFLDGSE